MSDIFGRYDSRVYEDFGTVGSLEKVVKVVEDLEHFSTVLFFFMNIIVTLYIIISFEFH